METHLKCFIEEAHNWCFLQKARQVLLEPKSIFSKNPSVILKAHSNEPVIITAAWHYHECNLIFIFTRQKRIFFKLYFEIKLLSLRFVFQSSTLKMIKNQIRRLLNLLGQLICQCPLLYEDASICQILGPERVQFHEAWLCASKVHYVRITSPLVWIFQLSLTDLSSINISMILSNSYVQNVWLRSTCIYALLPNRRTRYQVSNYIPQMNYLSIRRTFHKILENMHG